MTPNEYQHLAARTECDQYKTSCRIAAHNVSCNDQASRLIHAAFGIANEAGEFCHALTSHFMYGKDLDLVNLKEELGDAMWHIAQACNALGLSLEDVMVANIAKLQKRYPDKFEERLAHEEGRDRQAERKELEHLSYEEPAHEAYKDIVCKSAEPQASMFVVVNRRPQQMLCPHCKQPLSDSEPSNCPNCGVQVRYK